MRVQEAVTRPTPLHRLGSAPARMVPAAVKPTAQPVEIDTQSPRKFPWIAKRFAIWCVGTVLSATAFHLTDFVLLGVIAIVFPIGYWAKVVFEGQQIWGRTISQGQDIGVLERIQRDNLNRFIPGTPEHRMYHID